MEALTRQEELHSIHWDMYKDAFGIRPRHVDTSNWTEQAFTREFEHLARVIEENEITRLASEEKASHDFEMRVLSLISCGAKDREMALRWIHEAEGSNGDDEYLCYLMGLSYRYFVKKGVQ